MVDEVALAPRHDRPALIMAACAALLYLLYYVSTNAGQYGMDVGGHMQYIRHVAQHGTVPAPAAGWVFYHPPLYYIMNALAYVVFDALGAQRIDQWLRLFSLACYGVYLTYGYCSLRLLMPQRNLAFYAGWALLLFWPSGIYIASRIDSNVLFYPLWSAAFFYMLRWRQCGQPADMAYALGCMALGILTRSNALTLVPLIVFTLALAWRRVRGEWRKLLNPDIAAALLLLVAAAGYNHWRASVSSVDGSPQLVGNFAKLDNHLKLQTTPGTFLMINPLKLFFPPYNTVHNPNSGRDYYWLAFVKSSIYGEFGWKYQWLGRMINALLSVWMYCFFRGMYLTRGEYRRTLALPLAAVGVMLAASIYARIQYPAASTQDFRYVYPLLIPLAMIYASVVQRCFDTGRRGIAYTGLSALGLMMTGATVLIFLNVLIG